MNNLYKVTITGWVSHTDFGGGKYPPTTPADWGEDEIINQMTGITINETLIDTIPFPGEPGEDHPSTPWIRCMDHLIEELQTDGKDLPVGQRFEYGDVNTCWTCQDKGEESN